MQPIFYKKRRCGMITNYETTLHQGPNDTEINNYCGFINIYWIPNSVGFVGTG